LATFTALVLAGSRGEGDPLARARAVRHRALLEVAGEPMLLRVLRVLRASPRVGRVVVSIDEPVALAGVAEIEAARAAGALELHRSLASPSRSVLEVLERAPDGFPFLVTTADHALLSGAILEHFLAASEASGAQLLVGLVARETVEARFPGTRRTWLRFRGGAYSGANLFAFLTPEALRAARFWRRAESFRKRPWRLVAAFGPVSLALFALRRLALDAAMARASRAMGTRVEALALPFAEAAVDVDRPADLALAESVLAGAQSSREPSSAKFPAATS
jgi:GTP:adenosylcobinamide-phosphate guanylyltransferase